VPACSHATPRKLTGVEALALLALLAGVVYLLARRRTPPACPRCGLPRALALEVSRHRRFCP